jgi:23S rRNA (pseudouridine1915-N3)-methyltransferase
VRVTIAAVGKTRASPEQELSDLYLERTRAIASKLGISKLEIIVIDTSRAASAEARMAEEGGKLIAKSPPSPYLVALDEKGHAMTSEAFAQHLAKLRDSGIRDLVFLIGGPDGLAPSLRDGTQERLAFGTQTWPHLLVRAMLAEQLYRACAILSGHPYHRGSAGSSR